MNEQIRALNEEGRELWNQKAEFWDNLHGEEGNRWHRTLIGPAVEKLLALQAGERVLRYCLWQRDNGATTGTTGWAHDRRGL